MKFTWRVELKSGRTFECDLTEEEAQNLERGLIDTRGMLRKINEEIKEEDAL